MFDALVEEYMNLGWMDEELKVEQLIDILSSHVYLPTFKLEQIAKEIVERTGDSDDENLISKIVNDVIETVLDDIKPMS